MPRTARWETRFRLVRQLAAVPGIGVVANTTAASWTSTASRQAASRSVSMSRSPPPSAETSMVRRSNDRPWIPPQSLFTMSTNVAIMAPGSPTGTPKPTLTNSSRRVSIWAITMDSAVIDDSTAVGASSGSSEADRQKASRPENRPDRSTASWKALKIGPRGST